MSKDILDERLNFFQWKFPLSKSDITYFSLCAVRDINREHLIVGYRYEGARYGEAGRAAREVNTI